MFWLSKTVTHATENSSFYGRPATNQIFHSFIRKVYHPAQLLEDFILSNICHILFPKLPPLATRAYSKSMCYGKIKTEHHD
jgi:hypothetical protein